MANFIVTYDLNGLRPSHTEMDHHLSSLGGAFVTARVLETVWYVAGPATFDSLRDYAARILGPEDLLLVAEIAEAAWTNLLVDNPTLLEVFQRNRRAA